APARGARCQVPWRHGTRRTRGNPTAKMRSRFLVLRVRPANRDIPRDQDGVLPAVWLLAAWPPAPYATTRDQAGVLPALWLLAEWPPGAHEPTDYWLSPLPETTPLKTLVRLAKIRWR